jgi:hypothetical protein
MTRENASGTGMFRWGWQVVLILAGEPVPV